MNPSMTDRNLINELQTRGLRLTRPDQRHVSRRGGAGPTDHQAMTMAAFATSASCSGVLRSTVRPALSD